MAHVNYSLQGNLIVQQDSGLSVLETSEKLRIRTLIVDSDPEAVVRLQEIIRQDPEIDILGYCGNGNEALSVIRVARPDLIFLDVNISGIDGFSLIEKLRGGPMPVVIFVTAYDKYALQAFEVSALDYLLKPFAPERVRKALQKMKALLRHEDKPANGTAAIQRLAIRSGKKVFFLRPDEIHWIEAEGNSVRLHSGSESHTLKMSFAYFGVCAGACFATKYNIGLPLLVLPFAIWLLRKKDVRWLWPLEATGLAIVVFVLSNPYLVANPSAILFWIQKFDSFYVPLDDYYAKNIVFYYLEFLTRYNYNLPLIIAAIFGIGIFLYRSTKQGLIFALYPAIVFIWMCTYDTRRIHSLLPLHPFIAVWAAAALEALWIGTRRISVSGVFRFSYGILLAAVLFFPYSRAIIQTYLLSRLDNRSKAELWMTNHLPQGSRIALLQFHQVELDPVYFKVENFAPRDYIGTKSFAWFREHGFDYVVLSSGQYMRYFVEGESAEKYREYFQSFFEQGSETGALLLDLTTHPTLIPDYRIKVYSTQRSPMLQEFVASVPENVSNAMYTLRRSGTSLDLPPAYYSLEVPKGAQDHYSVRVRNLKMGEWILQKDNSAPLSAAEPQERFPFAIFPARLNSRFTLFLRSDAEVSPDQQVQFQWKNIADGLVLRQIQPDIEVRNVGLLEEEKPRGREPYLLFQKNQSFTLRCTLFNRSPGSIAGYVETFLSQVGEPQPWKDFESASLTQEFFLESGQEITIEVPSNTGDLTGDHQLSFWIFTRHDLPFSPQNGRWYTRQIRVDDTRLGIHPVYGIPIP